MSNPINISGLLTSTEQKLWEVDYDDGKKYGSINGSIQVRGTFARVYRFAHKAYPGNYITINEMEDPVITLCDDEVDRLKRPSVPLKSLHVRTKELSGKVDLGAK